MNTSPLIGLPAALWFYLVLAVLPASAQTLTEWREQNFASVVESGEAANLADGDKDGVVNLLEYALLLDPKKPGLGWGTATLEGTDLCLSYPRRKAALTEITFECQWATTAAGPWSNTGITYSTTSDDGTKQVIKAKTPVSGTTKRLMRIKATYTPPAPAAPTNLVATAASTTELDLTWADNSPYESGYKIERRPSGGTFSLLTTTAPNATSQHDTGLTPGLTYIYRVAATNIAGDSTFTSEARITMSVPLPPVPTNFAATAASTTQINLAWADNSALESSFVIERRQSGVPDFTVLTETVANVTAYQDTGLDEGWKYYYRIAAKNSAGSSAVSTVVNATTLSLPVAPSNLTATPVSVSQINLAWTDNSSNETGFKIERRQSGTPDFAVIGTTGAGATSFQNTGLPGGTRFHYRVSAASTLGDSAYSAVASADTHPAPPAAPTGLSATAVSSSQINLSWLDNSSNETGFRIERRQGGSGFAVVAEVGAGASTYSNTGLNANTRYDYQVYAVNPGGSSAYTSVAGATTSASNGLDGPGVGNLSYGSGDYMQILARVDHNHGIPPFNGHGYGMNVAAMHKGYLSLVFADDSGRGPGGFIFYDISNPRNPVMVNRLYDPSGITSEIREAHSPAFSNSFGGDYVCLQSGHGLEFWDWTDVRNPQRLSKIQLPNMNFGDYEGVVWHTAWQAPYVYCGSSEQGIFIVDASNPRNPQMVRQVSISQTGGFRVGPIFAVGNLLVIMGMNSTSGYSTLDISDPLNPQLIATTGNGHIPQYYSAMMNGNRIYSSTRNTEDDSGVPQAMYVHDISNPANIHMISSSLIVPHMQYANTQDEFIFQGGGDEFFKINRNDYQIVGRGALGVQGPDNGSVTPIGNICFVGNDHGSGSALFCHQISPDNRGPEVNMVNPINNSSNQARSSRIGVTLTDNVDLRSVNNGSFIVRPLGGGAISGKYSAQNALLNFWPDQPLAPNTTYEVVFPPGGIRDWMGNAISVSFTSRFTTRN